MTGYSRIVAHAFGGPEVLQLEHVSELPEPGAGEVRIRVEAAGVGYTDTILRRGRYIAYTGGLPLTPGYDVVGIVDKLGDGVTGLTVGQRVADMPVSGAYSSFMLRPASSLIPVPDGVPATAAVEVPLMYMTAWQMLTRIVDLPRGAPILAVGASGSTGRALVKLALHKGLKVIGTCSEANLPLVESLGAVALDYARPDLGDAIRHAAGGQGVAAAFDAIGGKSWEISWASLAPGGVLVNYGFQDFLESGASSDVAIKAMTWFGGLTQSGVVDGTGRSATFYDIRERRLALPDEYLADAAYLLAQMAKGEILPAPPQCHPLGFAEQAHRLIAKRGLGERIVLTP